MKPTVEVIAEAYTEGVKTAYNAIADLLVKTPPERSACEMGAILQRKKSAFVDEFVSEFNLRVSELS